MCDRMSTAASIQAWADCTNRPCERGAVCRAPLKRAGSPTREGRVCHQSQVQPQGGRMHVRSDVKGGIDLGLGGIATWTRHESSWRLVAWFRQTAISRRLYACALRCQQRLWRRRGRIPLGQDPRWSCVTFQSWEDLCACVRTSKAEFT